jgi:hypothetical protein
MIESQYVRIYSMVHCAPPTAALLTDWPRKEEKAAVPEIRAMAQTTNKVDVVLIVML